MCFLLYPGFPLISYCLQTGPLGFLKVAAMPDQEELEAIAGEN